MSSLSQFVGGRRVPTSIVQANAAAGFSFGSNVAFTSGVTGKSGANTILSGALTANTLATIISVTGAGEMHGLGLTAVDSTSRTVRLQITLDGVVIYDYTSAAVASADSGVLIVGSSAIASNGTPDGTFVAQNMPFNSSLVIKIASSLTETDKVRVHAKYWVC